MHALLRIWAQNLRAFNHQPMKFANILDVRHVRATGVSYGMVTFTL
jgi:hypothetical protein